VEVCLAIDRHANWAPKQNMEALSGPIFGRLIPNCLGFYPADTSQLRYRLHSARSAGQQARSGNSATGRDERKITQIAEPVNTNFHKFPQIFFVNSMSNSFIDKVIKLAGTEKHERQRKTCEAVAVKTSRHDMAYHFEWTQRHVTGSLAPGDVDGGPSRGTLACARPQKLWRQSLNSRS
jgi:hypothetical protein